VPRVWYNPDLRSRWFFVPAVLALVLMVMTMVLSSMGVVREKEIGTMEQLIVTPIRSWQLIVGKLLPYGLIGVIDVFIVVGIAVGWFGVPLRGSLTLLVALTMLLLLNTLGLGLLTSTVVASGWISRYWERRRPACTREEKDTAVSTLPRIAGEGGHRLYPYSADCGSRGTSLVPLLREPAE